MKSNNKSFIENQKIYKMKDLIEINRRQTSDERRRVESSNARCGEYVYHVSWGWSRLSCWRRTLCSCAREASSCSHSSSSTAAMAIFLVCAGTRSSAGLVRLAGPAGVPVVGARAGVGAALLLENILIKLLLPRLIPMSRLAGREMMEVVEADLWCGSSLEARSSLAVLTASSAPSSPGMTESILCLALPAGKVRSVMWGVRCGEVPLRCPYYGRRPGLTSNQNIDFCFL